MYNDDCLTLTDRQARAVIIAAEQRGFEREPDLYEAWYDLDLHEDARLAVAHLRAHDPGALRDALVAEEPIPADVAARRITDSGPFSLADATRVLEVASACGFTPPTTDLPLLQSAVMWDQARAAVAFLWEHHPALLAAEIGDAARLAPLPETVRSRRTPFWDD